jgi:hypothetical protein
MDRIHFRPHVETRTGENCKFCLSSDPEFATRRPMDKVVLSRQNGAASAHMSENGYILHRLLEIDHRTKAA